MDTGHKPLLAPWKSLVQAQPTAPALVDCSTGRTYSRADVQQLAEEMAARLPPRSRLHKRVIFRAPNGAPWLAMFLAIRDRGWVAVPVDPATSDAQATQLARAIKAAYLWLGEEPTLLTPRCGSRSTETALIKITSGSTGLPKSFPFSDAALAADGHNIIATMGLRPADRHYALIPFGHSYGLGNLVAPLLLQGCTLVCGSVPLPNVIASEILASGATVFPAVPAILSGLLRAEVSRETLATLRLIISAGAPLDGTLSKAFEEHFGTKLHNFYGSSETGGIAYDHTGDSAVRGSGIGTPLNGVTVAISSKGRVQVTSAAVTNEGKTTGLSDARRWQLADRGSWNERGEIALLGRTDRTIKLSGRRVDLAEIEHSIRQTPGVSEAYCLAVATPREHLIAAYTGDTAESAVWQKLKLLLPAWKLPKRLIHCDAFPVTARGKLDRSALEARLTASAENADLAKAFVPQLR
ncbi:MAG: class I adenylate-forming enzyme family protein [Verrucomicrobiota bacterium]|nr:class I adenylate-forming enzyme family protein [Verrucomicrobiota bacterium]